jgi:hypothetical protein
MGDADLVRKLGTARGDQPGGGLDPDSAGALARAVLLFDGRQHPRGQHWVKVGREGPDHGHAADVAHHVFDVGPYLRRLINRSDPDIPPARSG